MFSLNNFRARSERCADRGLRGGGEQPLEQHARAGLVEGFVQVAALRRLYARRAAFGARALRDQAVRVAAQLLET
jgi:hypothetical protein